MNQENPSQIDPRIQLLLEQLRKRVRIYIWLEGITLGLIWLALTFWFGFAIDYLPVLLGANELSAGIRAGLLVIVAVTLGIILYRLQFLLPRFCLGTQLVIRKCFYFL